MRVLEIFTVFCLVTMLSTVAEGAAVSGKCDIIILVANTNHIYLSRIQIAIIKISFKYLWNMMS